MPQACLVLCHNDQISRQAFWMLYNRLKYEIDLYNATLKKMAERLLLYLLWKGKSLNFLDKGEDVSQKFKISPLY